jgi:hypothetical protein
MAPHTGRRSRRPTARPAARLTACAAALALALPLLLALARAPDDLDTAPLAPTSLAATAQPTDEPPPLPEVILSFRDGREVQGLLVERTDDTYLVRINGIDTPFPEQSVDRVRTLPPVLERYRRMRDALADDDIEGILLLSEWLRVRGLYQLALDEVDRVLALEPYNGQASDMRTWLVGQIALSARRQAARPDPTAEADADADGRPRLSRTPREDDYPSLTGDEINLLRVYEVDLANPPRLLISRETTEAFFKAYAEHELIPATRSGRDALLRQRPDKILELMFRLQAREFYPEVRVLDDPAAFALFRERLIGSSGWVQNFCASNRCHGGEEAGRLWIQTRRPNSDASVYTNFLVLDRFRLADGTPLINYDEPARSPLLQMGLPREDSLYPHPEVGATRASRGWRPIFRSTSDRDFVRGVEWVRSMYRPRPDYPIDFEPPSPRPVVPPADPDAPQPER